MPAPAAIHMSVNCKLIKIRAEFCALDHWSEQVCYLLPEHALKGKSSIYYPGARKVAFCGLLR